MRKRIDTLPTGARDMLLALLMDIRKNGPARANWSHYGKLKGKGKRDVRHCHLNSGRPVYVAVWEIMDNQVRLVEVRYAGTHEKADYGRL